MAADEPVDEYESFDFAINTALVEALEALDVAFEQYEALEYLPRTQVEINGYGAEMLDDLSVAMRRNYQTSLGYRFEQHGLRAASELVQAAAGALREYAAGAEDSETYLAGVCHDLIASDVTPATAQELVSIARACMTRQAGALPAHDAGFAADATPGPSAA